MHTLLKTAFLRTFGFLLWTSFSAWLFVTVEYTGKDDKKEKYDLLLSLYKSMASKYNMSLEEFNEISTIAYEALSEPKPQWNYHVAVTFVIQAVTTIGYGFITPQTSAGQSLCIFVCLLGIPITLLTLKSIGELIAKWLNTIVSKFEKKMLKIPEPKQMQTKSAVILFSFMVLLIVVSALLIRDLHWSFVEGVYFWFVTFTTIGFGDYVLWKPARIKKLSFNNSESHSYKSSDSMQITFPIFKDLLKAFYYIVALCIVSSVLNAIAVVMEERRCRSGCPGCISRKKKKTDPKYLEEEEEKQESIPDVRDLKVEYSGPKQVGSKMKDVNISMELNEL
ncbi:potassium channel subfamily K member 9-like [Stylophora pistillata]|uniref:potassium channel subfamily K member 9-like n=1 Tax=Stylophora pistillata TaxID=50429 RepID=UPI000C0396AE|nr:potassium channel subfamily K member 9-like [Stylophora pistillata]